MLQQKKMLGAVAVLGLLAFAAAEAHDGPYYQGGQWSDPQVRLGLDVIWGGYGYAPRPPPVVWYPPHYHPGSYYDDGRRHWRGKGHRKHRRHKHRWSDSD